MIIVLFGQPNSGKTTLADALLEQNKFTDYKHVDGDQLRNIFKNKDFSKEGRIKNLNRASDIATYLDAVSGGVILSLVYPYKEARDYLESLSDNVKWIYLTYSEKRGRENFHVEDFEAPVGMNFMSLNTSELTITNCIKLINLYVG
jgi:adenylylsulfate kinase-like enzyme